MTKLPPEMIGTQNGDVVRYWQQRTAEAEAELARLTPVVEAAGEVAVGGEAGVTARTVGDDPMMRACFANFLPHIPLNTPLSALVVLPFAERAVADGKGEATASRSAGDSHLQDVASLPATPAERAVIAAAKAWQHTRRKINAAAGAGTEVIVGVIADINAHEKAKGYLAAAVDALPKEDR